METHFHMKGCATDFTLKKEAKGILEMAFLVHLRLWVRFYLLIQGQKTGYVFYTFCLFVCLFVLRKGDVSSTWPELFCLSVACGGDGERVFSFCF